jgi:hypothetical protein
VAAIAPEALIGRLADWGVGVSGLPGVGSNRRMEGLRRPQHGVNSVLVHHAHDKISELGS